MSNNDGYYARFESFEHDSAIWSGWADDLVAVARALPDPREGSLREPFPTSLQDLEAAYLRAMIAVGTFTAEGAREFQGFARKLDTIRTAYEVAERAAVDEIEGPA